MRSPVRRYRLKNPQVLALDFIRGHGPASAVFIADYFHADRTQFHQACRHLRDSGKVVRWYFDGKAIFGLPADMPTSLPPETQQVRIRRPKQEELHAPVT